MNSRFHYAAIERASHQDLLDITARKHGGNPESTGAFRSLKDRLTQAQERVLRCIKESGEQGRSNDEICVVLGLTPNQVSPRITELRMAGRIEKIGTKLTRSKCSAAVWRAV